MDVVVSPLVSELVGRLTDMAKEKVGLLLGVHGEIQKLQRTLRKIQSVLRDAERRRIEDEGVNDWLMELKDVMYDADDVLDECRTEAEKWTRESDPKPSTLCGFDIRALFHEVNFRREVGVKIKDLNDRLEEISARRSKLQLHVSAAEPREVSRVSRITSPVMESDMVVGVGMEKDAMGLVEQLTRQDPSMNVVVLAIVGIGGIGKTTLAQKVFNDDKIKASFGTTIWVCVSQEFNETDLLRNIVEGAGESHDRKQSRSLLEPLVERLLKVTTFLLVLDDVWDAQIWDDLLRNPLRGGAPGSRVLVTTRNAEIARQMKAAYVHEMNLLPPEDGWSLLCKKATINAEEERDAQDLKDTGMKIVEKCGGLPLAIKTIAGVLCKRGLDRSAWAEVLRSAAWSRTGFPEGVHGALHLSYQDLPAHLKQCFLYCTLFREDNLFKGHEIVRLWIAGFVEARGDVSLEETGDQYYRELLDRSLLQSEPNDDLANESKMHDLLRSLGHFLSRDESLFISDVQKEWRSGATPMKLRRLSIAAMNIRDIVSLTKRHELVRTLLVERTRGSVEDIDDCLKNLVRLRVLHLDSSNIQSLPHYIGNLIHLRYLNVSYSRVTELPESICNLTNLQFLIARACKKLTQIPQGIVRLVNLRTLDFEYTQLKSFPYGLGRLNQLNELGGFVMKKGNVTSSLEELGSLQELRDLSIYKLKRARLEAQPRSHTSGLKGNKKLKNLRLNWASTSKSDDCREEFLERIAKVLDVALQPPSSVVSLELYDFLSLRYPSWMASASISSFLPNLSRLGLFNCNRWTLLPPLGKLPSLEFLEIVDAHAVTTIGPEFLGCEGHDRERNSNLPSSSSSPPTRQLFPKLRQLKLLNMDNMEVWDWEAEVFAMCRLDKLVLHQCPKLKSLPEGLIRQAICLTTLDLTNVNALESIRGFPSVKTLSISGASDLKIVADLPALELLNLGTHSRPNNHLPEWLKDCPACFTSVWGTNQLLVGCDQDDIVLSMIKQFPIFSIKDDRGNYINYSKHSDTFKRNLVDDAAAAAEEEEDINVL
ncbi:NB-ARC domain [Musa troglodytarum]|uniref:NB-ARC domain n=1 Tax=Musa troglodytarum TaxID=320322 RepID=A0A9E7EAC2_9LILI|nr:NB-ARC domain [Musa troglodytarum]